MQRKTKQQRHAVKHMIEKKEVFGMDVEKIIAILVALIEDQENVKATYTVHREESNKEKTA